MRQAADNIATGTRIRRSRRARRATAGVAVVSCLLLMPYAAAQLTARAAVEEQECFVGEAFTFQIQASGATMPEPPDVSGIKDFKVEFVGKNDNSSVRIVNGRMTRSVQRIFSYRLTPKRAGTLTIPAVEVAAAGRTARTQPLQIVASKPTEVDDFKLRLKLSKDVCYVGEPVTLEVTWYIGRQPRNIAFSLPILEHPDFTVPQADLTGVPDERIWQLGDTAVVIGQGRARLDERSFTALRFEVPLIPKKAGVYNLSEATVSCDALAGYRDTPPQRRRGPFDDSFFDGFFGNRRREVYKRVVIPSNALELQVRELPAAGRPEDFTGLVGEYRIETSAGPADVNVGDPITLTIRVSGPEYLDNVDLPPLEEQAELARDFKIPKDMAPGKVEGHVKVFTQTVRAVSADVSRIPPVRLSYFNTTTGRYETATSKPIPLTVRMTKVVTAQDAEGHGPLAAGGRALEAWSRGIAHNYEDLSVLQNQRCGPEAWLESPVWLCAIGALPGVYFALLLSVGMLRRRNADPLAQRSRKAYATLMRDLRAGRGEIASASHDQVCAAVLDALRRYLGGKLRIPSGALTYADVEARLRALGVSAEALAALKGLFEQCVAGRYAGAASSAGDLDAMTRRAGEVAGSIERVMK